VRSDLAVVLRAGQAVATAVSYTIKQPNGHQRATQRPTNGSLSTVYLTNCRLSGLLTA
jgi:hypothetical protein